jgi:hypothetical protein
MDSNRVYRDLTPILQTLFTRKSSLADFPVLISSMSGLAIMHKLRLRRITSGSPTTRPCERYNPLRCCRHEVVV